MSGVELIAVERERQVSVEGWTPEHDDTHTKGEMADAGACYALEAAHNSAYVAGRWMAILWPWSTEWWKPSHDRIRNLVKAGALIAAEIDRLQRLEASR